MVLSIKRFNIRGKALKTRSTCYCVSLQILNPVVVGRT